MKISIVCVVVAATAVMISACAPTSLMHPTASQVRVTNNEPGKACTFLGDVTGSQGNFLLGAITSNADLETGARNDIKNKASALGGNVVYLITQRAGQTGGKNHQEQTNVTLSGNVYRCPAGEGM